jgi:copper(I)-binding protein
MKRLIITCLALSLSADLARAQVSSDDLRLTYGIGTRPSVVHGQLSNDGDKAIYLIGVTSPSFDRIELHTHEKIGQVMRMRRVERYALEAGQSLGLKPGGKHLMLFEPKSTDTPAQIMLTFRFDNGEKLHRQVPAKAAKRQTSHGHHSGH